MINSKKSICFVLTVEFAVKTFLLNHLRALSDTYDVTVIVNTDNPNFLMDLGVNAKVIPLAIARDIRLLSDFYCLIQLIIIFYQQRFASVHSITPKAGLLAMSAAWFTNIPLRIHTFQGEVWVTKTGLMKQLLILIDKMVAKLSNQLIVVSQSEKEFLIAQHIIEDKKSFVFNKGSISGVDIERFKPNQQYRINIRQQLKIPNDVIIFLFIGRLTLDKGVLDLAQAFAVLNAKHAVLLYVGPDEQNMQTKIKLITKNCSDRIHFIGYTVSPESYMAAADILCLPSYREGFGSVAIEAAAIGLPAIASDIYGISDAVVDNETGLLHAPHNIEAIKHCLEIMLNNSALRLKLGQQAQARAIKDFDSHLITQAWVDFYKQNLFQ